MNGVMLKLLAVVLPCAAAGGLLYVTRARGDVPTLPGTAKHEVSVTANGSQFGITAYAAGDILAVWPVPAFKADPTTGHVAVDYEPPLKPGGLAKVSVHLLMNPSPLLKAAQAEIAAHQGKAVPPLTSVLLRELKVEEEHGKQSRLFEPFSLPGESSGIAEYTLEAYLPDDEAKVYAELLRAGKRHAGFRVTASLYAVRKGGEADVTAGVVKIKDTKAYTELNGTGGAGGVQNGGDKIEQKAATVTRGQRQELTAKVREEIVAALKVTGNLKNPEIVTKQVEEFMKSQAFGKERQIDISVAELAKLNPYGFSPDDLRPDVIEKFVADVKNKLEDENQHKFSIAVGGSAFGISANASFSRDELKKKLEDKGWRIEQEGKKYIPRSVSVSDVNRQSIEAHVGFKMALVESAYDVVRFDQRVTTRARVAVDMSPNELNRLAALERLVRDLPTQVRIPNVVVALKANGRAERKGKEFTFPYYADPFDVAPLAKYRDANWLPLCDETGKLIEFEEVLSVDQHIRSRLRDQLAFWSIDTRVVKLTSGKFGIELVAIGFNNGNLPNYGFPATVGLDLVITTKGNR